MHKASIGSSVLCAALWLAGCFEIQEPIGVSDERRGDDRAGDGIPGAGTGGEGWAGSGGWGDDSRGAGTGGEGWAGSGGWGDDSRGAGTGGEGGWAGSGGHAGGLDGWAGSGGWGDDSRGAGTGGESGWAGSGGYAGGLDAGSGGHAGDGSLVAGTGGYGGVDGWAGSGGWSSVDPSDIVCDCDDGDPCTLDRCSDDGRCTHHLIGDGSGPDQDRDGVPASCDCNDYDADVRPGQTEFFDHHPSGPRGSVVYRYDWNCDGWETPLLTAAARPCSVAPGFEACLGSGWLLRPGESIPYCSSGGAYQMCAYRDGRCEATTVTMLQACR